MTAFLNFRPIKKGHVYMNSYGQKVLATADESLFVHTPIPTLIFAGIMEGFNQSEARCVSEIVSECNSQFPLYDLDGNLFLFDTQEAYDTKLAEIHGDLKEWAKVNYEVEPKQEKQ